MRAVHKYSGEAGSHKFCMCRLVGPELLPLTNNFTDSVVAALTRLHAVIRIDVTDFSFTPSMTAPQTQHPRPGLTVRQPNSFPFQRHAVPFEAICICFELHLSCCERWNAAALLLAGRRMGRRLQQAAAPAPAVLAPVNGQGEDSVDVLYTLIAPTNDAIYPTLGSAFAVYNAEVEDDLLAQGWQVRHVADAAQLAERTWSASCPGGLSDGAALTFCRWQHLPCRSC